MHFSGRLTPDLIFMPRLLNDEKCFRRSPVHALLAVAWLASSLSCHAQWGLQALLGQAVMQHPTVHQARQQAQAAGYDRASAQWSRYPTLSSELRSETGPSQHITRLEQPLWTGGKISGQVQAAVAHERAAWSQVAEAELNVLIQVSVAFFEALRLQARLEGAMHNVVEHERLLSLIARRVQAEISPPADQTLAQARLQQAVSERIQITRLRDAARVTLQQWVGEPVESIRAPQSIAFQRSASQEQVMDLALAFSPALQRLVAQSEVAQAQIAVSQAQVMPNLVLGHQRTWGHLYTGQWPEKTYLSLQFTTGAGLSALSNRQAAIARKASALAEIGAFRLTLQGQIQSNLSELDALMAQLVPSRALVNDTAQLVDSYLRQYQIGRKSWLDVLNAQREKTNALYSLADTQYGLQLAQVRLMIVTGELRSDALTAIHD